MIKQNLWPRINLNRNSFNSLNCYLASRCRNGYMPPPDQKYSRKNTGNSSVWSGKRQAAFYRSEKLGLLLIIHDDLLFFAGIINQMERILCCFNAHLEIPIFFRSFPISQSRLSGKISNVFQMWFYSPLSS